MTAVLTATPNPVTAAGDPFTLDGTGFEVRQTRIVFNGVTGPIFRPAADGTFSQNFVASSATTQSIRAEQCIAGSWSPVANLTLTIGSIYTPPGTPFADIVGPPAWILTHADEMDREVPRGQFLAGSVDNYRTADGRYFAFKNTWHDTSGHGMYDPAQIEISGGVLDILCSTVSGIPRTATITARPTGSSSQGGQLGMRAHIRARMDSMVGYKGIAGLGWADAAHTNDDLKLYGEIDLAEAESTNPVHSFMHRTGSSSLSDQYVFVPSPDTVSYQTWHDYVFEWIAGTSLKVFIDGVQIGATQTSRVPNTPMHLNCPQVETATGGAPAPSSGVSGHYQIERIGIWRPA